MGIGKAAIFVTALVAALGFGAASVKADNSDACSGTPFDAVMRLPTAIAKWGHIACTPIGHVLESRDGWLWASVDSGSDVLIPSQVSSRNPREVGNGSYFTTIKATLLAADDAAAAVSLFNDGLKFDESDSKVYRVEVVSVSGATNTLYFFDFGSFAGGMACPDGECDPDTRFLIIERLSKPVPPGI